MTRQTETLPLPSPAPGTTRSLLVHRWGTSVAAGGTGPKAYLQASLHADELPGQLVLHHLIPLLDAAEAAGAITGEIVVVPFANPIGYAQMGMARHLGRHDAETLGNFNRHYPALVERVAARLASTLDQDGAANVRRIRAALLAEIAALEPRAEVDHLRRQLYALAADADIVLDLHCDDRGLMYLYVGAHVWPDAADLSAQLGCHAAILADDSGGEPFDETLGGIFWRLRQYFPALPIPSACLSATLELRGQGDVDDVLAAGDARNLFAFLQRRGLIAGDPGPLPMALCPGTPIEAVDVVESPGAGVIVWQRRLGERVRRGDVVAEIMDPTAAPGTPRAQAIAGTDGLLFTTVLHPLARPGLKIAKIVGTEILAHRTGYLLED
jgi:predicted deacylase